MPGSNYEYSTGTFFDSPEITSSNLVTTSQLNSNDLSNIKSFAAAFAEARRRGLKTFKWKSIKGNPSGLFGTQLATLAKEVSRNVSNTPVANKSTKEKTYDGGSLSEVVVTVPGKQNEADNRTTSIPPRSLALDSVLNLVEAPKQIIVAPSNSGKKKQNWFTNAVLNAAMADLPAVMTASGWRINETGDIVLDLQDSEGVKLLRDALTILSNFANYGNLYGLLKAQNIIRALPAASTARAALPVGPVIYKTGGNINKKYLKGGTMNNQEELQKAFMAYLIQDAAAQGIQLQSEQDLQAYAQQLGEDGIKAKYQEFMLKMQGGVMARLGAKLEYYKKLKGVCPEGEELVYFKQGGRICKACQKGAKATKKLNEVEQFKAARCGSKMKKKK